MIPAGAPFTWQIKVKNSYAMVSNAVPRPRNIQAQRDTKVCRQSGAGVVPEKLVAQTSDKAHCYRLRHVLEISTHMGSVMGAEHLHSRTFVCQSDRFLMPRWNLAKPWAHGICFSSAFQMLLGRCGTVVSVSHTTWGILEAHGRRWMRSLINHAKLRGSRRIVWWRMLLCTRRSETFNDRLNIKLVRDRRPLLTTTTDKVAVREVIEATLGPGHLSELLAVASSPRGIDWDELPEEFVAKVNHGSGGMVIVSRDAPLDARLPTEPGRRTAWKRYRVQPEMLLVPHLIALLESWLELDYSWMPGRKTVVNCYRDIPRRVLVEGLLRDIHGAAPAEYRLFVINGRVEFIQAEIDPFGQPRTAVMSREWTVLPVQLMDPPPAVTPPRPENLPEMLQIAEKLGALMVDFVRVDLYDLLDRIVVGEMTHFPIGGRPRISSEHYARLWGQNWVTPY